MFLLSGETGSPTQFSNEELEILSLSDIYPGASLNIDVTGPSYGGGGGAGIWKFPTVPCEDKLESRLEVTFRFPVVGR